MVKNLSANAGDPSWIPGLVRSPGKGSESPLQYFLLGKSHGQRSLVGYSPWGCKESNTTEQACTREKVAYIDMGYFKML